MTFANHIFCCINKRPDGHPRGSCADKGSAALKDYFKARVKELGLPETRVNMAGCLDRCEEGPAVVIYPEGTWYTLKTRADVDRVIAQHLQQGTIVQDLTMP